MGINTNVGLLATWLGNVVQRIENRLGKIEFQFDTVQDMLADSAMSYSLASIVPGVFIFGGVYKYEVVDAATMDFDVQTAGGVKLRCLRNSDGSLHVEQFGAVPHTVGGTATDVSSEFQAALDAQAAYGGGVVMATAQYYVITSKIKIPTGTKLCGLGCDEWEPIFPNRPKKWNGSNLIFKGTGTKDVSFEGVTSMKEGGGWREDPDNPGSYFKLTSMYNQDATGTTPATNRQFSAAITNADGANYIGLKDLRIVNWSGSDGLAGHSDTGSTSLGDDWDIGLLLKNSEYSRIENVQVVGDWREYAHLEIATAISESRSERNRRVGCKFQGRIGFGVRAPDRWAVSATTVTTATILWTDESYWASSGTFRGSDNVTYSYTGTSRVSGDLVFTGVTPDPTGIFHVRHPSAGFGNTELQDCYSYGLDHVSGNDAAFFGLADSKPLEASGFPLRGVKFRNFKVHTSESVVSHLHDCADFVFIDPQFEGGGHIIASPSTADQSYANAPVGDTRNLVTIADHGVADNDLRLFLPRSGLVQGISIAPRDDLTGDLVITPTRDDKDTKVVVKSGQNFRVMQPDGTTGAVRVTASGNTLIENGGQLSMTGGSAIINADASANFYLRNGTTNRVQLFGGSGNFGAGADNAQAWGTASFRWANVYSNQFRAGDGSVIWTSGSGSPEGSVAANVGSMYTRTDGGAGTTLYIKESGSGNTGWVAK